MLNIRIAELKDAEKIAKNNVYLAKESEDLDIDYKTTYKGVKAIISDKNKGFFIVTELNRKIIGELMVTYEWSDWRSKDFWWIQSVYVDKEHRKQGIFNKMKDFIIKLAKENNIDKVRLYVHNKNKDAINAYEKSNMKKDDYIIYKAIY